MIRQGEGDEPASGKKTRPALIESVAPLSRPRVESDALRQRDDAAGH
jgi:hypothetical protein